ncbi:MAG: LysE family transporter [Chloroflexi bacterium]|jgi:threonine/homoserine/homoserine lactone efflux protein|nr:LysE family transporter [Chloroflexota bacterium]
MPDLPAAEYLATGILLGLAAGFAPGPLMALVLAQAVRFGTREGLKVAIAPLITDIPIVALATALVGLAAGAVGGLLGAISLAGAVFVAWLGVESVRTTGVEAGRPDEAPRSWSRGALVNALSPHPYLFWVTVGAPVLIRAWGESAIAAAAFLAGFYACLVGAKMLLAVIGGASGGRLRGGAYRAVMVVLGALLLLFAARLAWEGLRLLGLVAT